MKRFTDSMSLDEFRRIQRKKPKHAESNLQKICVRWFDQTYPNLKQRLFAIPNGGKRGVITATIMKAEGVRKGIPDIFLAVPQFPYGGMFIEMKTADGKLRPEQKEFIDAVQQFYKCVVCRSLEEFQQAINNYLN